MEPWAKEVLQVWKDNIRLISEAIITASETNPAVAGKYTVEDIAQMMLGVHAMMAERLGEGNGEVYDTYINTVIPGILAQGEKLSVLVRYVALNGMMSSHSIAPLLSSEHRDAGVAFVQNWWAEHVCDIVAQQEQAKSI
jgi:hypothetical protein